jgi:ribonuclease III
MTIPQEVRITMVPIPSPRPHPPVISDELYRRVLTHTSAAKSSNAESYERLAILGNSCLHAAVTRILYECCDSQLDPGQIDEIRQKCTDGATVLAWAREYDFHERIDTGLYVSPEENSILRGAFYAFFGAIWLTLSMDQVTEFVRRLLEPTLATITIQPSDPQIAQKLHERLGRLAVELPQYVETKDEDAGLEERFMALCKIGETCLGKGVARSKKVAKWRAAEAAMKLDDKALSQLRSTDSSYESED